MFGPPCSLGVPSLALVWTVGRGKIWRPGPNLLGPAGELCPQVPKRAWVHAKDPRSGPRSRPRKRDQGPGTGTGDRDLGPGPGIRTWDHEPGPGTRDRAQRPQTAPRARVRLNEYRGPSWAPDLPRLRIRSSKSAYAREGAVGPSCYTHEGAGETAGDLAGSDLPRLRIRSSKSDYARDAAGGPSW